MRTAIMFLCLAFATSSIAADDAATEGKTAAPAQPDFSVVCSNAWIKCVTDADPTAYALDADMKFSFTLEGVTNAIPSGKYLYSWKRTGDDGAEESGTAPLEKKPFVYATKLAQPGFVRVAVEIVTADGKPFMKTVGKNKERLAFVAGAGAEPRKLASASAASKEFAKRMRELKRKLPVVQYKKVQRQEVADAGLNGVKAFKVSIPCADDRPMSGYLTVPSAEGGTKFPCRLATVGCGFASEQKPPAAKDVRADEVAFFLAFDPGKEGERDEAFYTGLFLRLVRALQYLKSLPEWNGRDLSVGGWGMSGMQAVWAAGCDEGVTSVQCGLVARCEAEAFDTLEFARLVPPTCMVEIQRAGLADAERPPSYVARLWNALPCEKRLLWVQGCEGWSEPRWYKGRDFQWEKLSPVRYRNMDAEHCKPIRRNPENSFKDLGLAFRDKVVIEALFDYCKPATFQHDSFSSTKNYAGRDLKPIEIYAVIPEKKVKQKQWEKFLEVKLGKEGGSFSFPIYLDAGMDLPPPPSLPWFHLVDTEGVLRYSGPDFDAAVRKSNEILGALAPADPVFAYAKPDLMKDEIAKLRQKSGLAGQKLYKALEMSMRKYSRTDSARAAEAEHILIGMRQAKERRISEIGTMFGSRAGKALNELRKFVAEWPELEADSRIKGFRSKVTQNPELEKLAKLEAELDRLHAWHPEKKSDVKKKDAALDALRKKVSRSATSKDASIQGEAMLMQAEIDNPPQPDPVE